MLTLFVHPRVVLWWTSLFELTSNAWKLIKATMLDNWFTSFKFSSSSHLKELELFQQWTHPITAFNSKPSQNKLLKQSILYWLETFPSNYSTSRRPCLVRRNSWLYMRNTSAIETSLRCLAGRTAHVGKFFRWLMLRCCEGKTTLIISTTWSIDVKLLFDRFRRHTRDRCPLPAVNVRRGLESSADVKVSCGFFRYRLTRRRRSTRAVESIPCSTYAQISNCK